MKKFWEYVVEEAEMGPEFQDLVNSALPHVKIYQKLAGHDMLGDQYDEGDHTQETKSSLKIAQLLNDPKLSSENFNKLMNYEVPLAIHPYKKDDPIFEKTTKVPLSLMFPKLFHRVPIEHAINYFKSLTPVQISYMKGHYRREQGRHSWNNLVRDFLMHPGHSEESLVDAIHFAYRNIPRVDVSSIRDAVHSPAPHFKDEEHEVQEFLNLVDGIPESEHNVDLYKRLHISSEKRPKSRLSSPLVSEALRQLQSHEQRRNFLASDLFMTPQDTRFLHDPPGLYTDDYDGVIEEGIILEAPNPLTEIESGVTINYPRLRGYNHRLFHSYLTDEQDPNKKTNLWLSLFSHPEKGEHEFHFSIDKDVTPDVFQERADQIHRQYPGHTVDPIMKMAANNLINLPTDKFFSPTTMFDIFAHVKNVSEQIPANDKIIFDMTAGGAIQNWGGKKAGIYRRYLQRLAASGMGQILPSDHPNKIVVQKF